MVRDSHAVGGSVLSSISVTTKQVGHFAYTRQDGNPRVSPSATPSAQDTRGRMPLRDAEVEQQVVRGGAPLCDGFQNASLVLRQPQCVESVENACRTAGCTIIAAPQADRIPLVFICSRASFGVCLTICAGKAE